MRRLHVTRQGIVDLMPFSFGAVNAASDKLEPGQALMGFGLSELKFEDS